VLPAAKQCIVGLEFLSGPELQAHGGLERDQRLHWCQWRPP
jgi:hypothetical protein